MTRLARRNKVRWHKLMKQRGLKWMRGAFWQSFTWSGAAACAFKDGVVSGTIRWAENTQQLIEELTK